LNPDLRHKPAIRLSSKPGQRLDSSEIDACLDHTVGTIHAPADPPKAEARRDPP
jgi:hypothetical protein